MTTFNPRLFWRATVFVSVALAMSLLFLTTETQAQTTLRTQEVQAQTQEQEAGGSENAEQTEEAPALPPLIAEGGDDRNGVIGRPIQFSAAASTQATGIVEGEALGYQWDFGDGEVAQGLDASHTYAESGRYTVTLTVSRAVNGVSEPEATDTFEVNIQDRLIVLMTDASVPQATVDQVQDYGLTQGALVVSLRVPEASQDYIAVQQLTQQLINRQDDLREAEIVMSWTAGNVGLNALIELTRAIQLNQSSIEQYRFNEKAIVAIADTQSITTTSRFAQSLFRSFSPEYIVVGNRSLVNIAIRSNSPAQMQEALRFVETEYQIITPYTARGIEKLGPFNFMSYAMNYMVNNGVPVNSLFLILMLPVLATIVAATRQIIGIKAFGIYVPTITALSFLAMGLKYGIAIFLSLVLLGSLARVLARKLRIMYLPRMAVVLSLLAGAIFLMFLLGAYFDKTGFIAISIFPILILTVITEHFVTVQIEQGWKSALRLTLETLALSLIGYSIADWTWFKSIILAFPELILSTLVINVIIGKFTGLRLTEYIRFRTVLKHIRNAEPSK